MKTTIILLTILPFCGTLVACGGTGDPHASQHPSSGIANRGAAATTVSQAAPAGGYWKFDDDDDRDEHQTGPSKDDEQDVMPTATQTVTGTEKQTITAVVHSYYAAATAGDGIKGCSLLASSLATAIAQGQSPPPYGSTKSCPTSLSQLFKSQHHHFATENVATMVVTGVHVGGNGGFVTLGFRKIPESELALLREGRTWKVDALFDSTLP
jgi:hypothetical protein